MIPTENTAETKHTGNWFRSIFQRTPSSGTPKTAKTKVNHGKPPAPFCTHIATTMHWRIGDGS